MIVLGIDPGAKGALAFFNSRRGTLTVADMPIVALKRGKAMKNEVNPQLLTELLLTLAKPDLVLLEKVGAMPGQGVSSMFQFGRSVGAVEGVIAALKLRLDYITPQKWQKLAGIRGGPDGSRARAVQLFPAYAAQFARKKDDGRADAALMAWVGATL